MCSEQSCSGLSCDLLQGRDQGGNDWGYCPTVLNIIQDLYLNLIFKMTLAF